MRPTQHKTSSTLISIPRTSASDPGAVFEVGCSSVWLWLISPSNIVVYPQPAIPPLGPTIQSFLSRRELQTHHSPPDMASSPSELQGSSPVPAMPHPNDNTRMHTSSLSSSSSSISDAEPERRSRAERPRMASRKPSASILVPRDHPEIEIEEEEFPPDDARAMSPRRNSADLERLGKEARQTLQE